MKKSKRQMAVIITSQLLGKLVPATNWRVKAILKMNESRIETLYKRAQTCMEAKIELDVGWKVALSTLPQKTLRRLMLQEIGK